ncbi:hypothetical protein [Planotetraspora mira]|nr:hypothetical protein [Planotetraspora mira]
MVRAACHVSPPQADHPVCRDPQVEEQGLAAMEKVGQPAAAEELEIGCHAADQRVVAVEVVVLPENQQ